MVRSLHNLQGMKKQLLPPTQYVESGSYVISRKKNVVLQAILGTCVGVVICDREARIGGLCHLLLAGPAGQSDVWHPEKYAKTGLPMFIAEMETRGASIENMEAFVAGGALVGPLSNLDLSLDIGGRTAEMVFNILEKEKIPVIRSETGGYFTCNLRLNMIDLKAEIVPPEDMVLPTSVKIEKPSQEKIGEILRGVRPIPQIALKITRMIQDDKNDLKDLAREVRQDQVISVKVLSLCNSVFLGAGREIKSIDEAMVVLGNKALLQLAVSASMEIFFSSLNADGYSLCKGGLFHHAVGTALLCERLARKLQMPSPEVAYTAGLLHDIGRAALDQYVAHAFPLFYRRTQVGEEALIKAEQDILGISHTDAGFRLALAWSLPKVLAEVIRFHHNPKDAPNYKTMTSLVYVAEVLMSRFNTGLELERIQTNDFESAMKTIGLGLHMLPRMVELVPGQVSFLSPASALRRKTPQKKMPQRKATRIRAALPAV